VPAASTIDSAVTSRALGRRSTSIASCESEAGLGDDQLDAIAHQLMPHYLDLVVHHVAGP
jgi:hypothetical protein